MTWATKESIKMFWPARLVPVKFPRIELVIVPSISKVACRFTSILFLTLVTC